MSISGSIRTGRTHYDHDKPRCDYSGRTFRLVNDRLRDGDELPTRMTERNRAVDPRRLPQRGLAALQPPLARERPDRGDPRGLPREPAGLPRRVRPPRDRRGLPLVTGHGPHFLRGIEIYQGRPIFYSLGNFIFHNDTVAAAARAGIRAPGPRDRGHAGRLGRRASGDGATASRSTRAFYRSAIAVCEFAGGELREITAPPRRPRLRQADEPAGQAAARRAGGGRRDHRLASAALGAATGPEDRERKAASA